MRVNLFFDPEVRARQAKDQDIEIVCQKERLDFLKHSGETIEDAQKLRAENRYYKLTIEGDKLTGFMLDDKKLEKERLTHGFFSLLTLGLEMDAVSTLRTYALRDEQEKYFEQMKAQMGFATQDNWSEDGKTGRLFILFVGLILASHVRHIWKTTELHDSFDSSLAVLDEMRCIRSIEEPGNIATMTPFVGDQLKICEAFGIPVPDGCRNPPRITASKTIFLLHSNGSDSGRSPSNKACKKPGACRVAQLRKMFGHEPNRHGWPKIRLPLEVFCSQKIPR